MDFLKLTVNGKPALIRSDLIHGVIPPLKGKGTLLICADQDLNLTVDETFDEVEEALTSLQVEVIECANDLGED